MVESHGGGKVEDLCVGLDPSVPLTSDDHGGGNTVQLQAEEKTGNQGIEVDDNEVPRNNADDTEPDLQVSEQEVCRDISNVVMRDTEVKTVQAIIKKRILSPVLLNIKL